MLGLHSEDHPDRTVLIVRGDVDLTVLPELRSALVDAIHTGRPLVELDLAGVPFIDSAGLGVVIGGLKRARTHGKNLIVIQPSPRVRKVLELTDLDEVLGCRLPFSPSSAPHGES